MCKVEEELPTPPEILKTIEILAPKGSPLEQIEQIEQIVAAMHLAVDLYQAKVKPPKVDKISIIFSI